MRNLKKNYLKNYKVINKNNLKIIYFRSQISPSVGCFVATVSCPDFRRPTPFGGQVWPPFGNAKTHRMPQCSCSCTCTHRSDIAAPPPSPPAIDVAQNRADNDNDNDNETCNLIIAMRIAALGNDNESLGKDPPGPPQPEPRRWSTLVATSSSGSGRSRNQRVATVPGTLPSRVRILSTCVAVCFNGQFLTLNGCRPVSCQRQGCPASKS